MNNFRKITLTILLVLSSFLVFSQSKNDDRIVCILPIEIQPSFPFGNDSLFKFLYSKIKIPKEYLPWFDEFRGTFYASFYVEKNGEITNPKIVKGWSQFPKLEIEIINAIKLMPKWKAGEQNGKKVKVKFILPLKFGFYDSE